MKILIATPLYPPDIARPALYVKELARRLAQKNHEVAVIAYTRLPEKIPGVRITAVDKRRPLLVRLFLFVRKFWRNTRKADAILMQNGPAVELPVLLVSFFAQKPTIILAGDLEALERSRKSRVLSLIEALVKKRALATITEIPPEKPEILPFKQYPGSAMKAYEHRWEQHLTRIEKTIVHA